MKKFSVFGNNIFIDGKTSSFSFSEDECLALSRSSYDFDALKPSYADYVNHSATFCLSVSDACNLACSYCFNTKKSGKAIPLSFAEKYLDLCFQTFPDKEKYFIDLSGKGEPLIFLSRVLEIKDYCVRKQDELNREVLVQFVCNGTLLSKEVSETLQKHGILFGVSIDGNEIIHDKQRRTKDDRPTYKSIITNVESIIHHEYVGVAATLTKETFSLVNSLMELGDVFNTVGYKPARVCNVAMDAQAVEKWCHEYDELAKFLLRECSQGNLRHIKILLNGDDYFGKFVKRCFLGQRVVVRCDGGLSRFSFNDDGNIYCCPAAFGEKEFRVGNEDEFDLSASSRLFYEQLNMDEPCHTCEVRHICGGECMIERKLSGGINAIMCLYKRHLIHLAMWLTLSLFEKNETAFEEVLAFCKETASRNRYDPELMKFLKAHHEYKFTEGKAIFDKMEKKY